MAETIKMRRDEPAYPGGPVTADVDASQVDEYIRAGWERGQSAPSSAPEAIADAPDTQEIPVTPKRGRRSA
jgi:hypothetical protein